MIFNEIDTEGIEGKKYELMNEEHKSNLIIQLIDYLADEARTYKSSSIIDQLESYLIP